MNFIFPKNYNFKPKLFGIMDYSTAILNIIIILTILFFSNIFLTNTTTKIYVFISLYFPVFLFSIVGVQRESPITVFTYIFHFIKNSNIYLYNKN